MYMACHFNKIYTKIFKKKKIPPFVCGFRAMIFGRSCPYTSISWGSPLQSDIFRGGGGLEYLSIR